ncbi:MAG: hypothetical protein HY681_06460 [Chloroflexi bacterium]|nr:hypothetical protein [Chloroflexota bacterium]
MAEPQVVFEVKAPKSLPSDTYPLVCDKCGKEMGILVLPYFGVRHHLDPIARCKECLDAAERTEKARG